MRRSRVWLSENGRTVFGSSDFSAGVVVATGVGLAAAFGDHVKDNAVTILITTAALGAALLAVVLAALAIIATFLDDHYRQVLRRAPGGIKGALLPFEIIGVIGALSACIGIVTATVWQILPGWLQAASLALATGTGVWALVGTAQLVGLTTFHGIRRARLHEGFDELRGLLRERQKQKSA